MLLIPPLSVAGSTPIYLQNYIQVEGEPYKLPELGKSRLQPSLELCGDQGVYVAVGYPSHSIVYRGTWDAKQNRGTWNFSYFKEDQ